MNEARAKTAKKHRKGYVRLVAYRPGGGKMCQVTAKSDCLKSVTLTFADGTKQEILC